MKMHSINLLPVLALLLALSGSVLGSSGTGGLAAREERSSLTIGECKISCEQGSPVLLKGEWTCLVADQMQLVATNSGIFKDGCDNILKAKNCNIFCQDSRDCRQCCGHFLAPFCYQTKCGCL